MLVIRFATVGRKNHKQYRIVVQEKTKAPTGRHAAVLGSYDPHTKVSSLKTDEIKKWLANGAQSSDSVHNLLVREGVIDAPKRVKKLPAKKVEEAPEEEKSEESPAEESEEPAEEAPAEEKKD